jgi:hypothetical protein
MNTGATNQFIQCPRLVKCVGGRGTEDQGIWNIRGSVTADKPLSRYENVPNKLDLADDKPQTTHVWHVTTARDSVISGTMGRGINSFLSHLRKPTDKFPNMASNTTKLIVAL